MADDWHIKIWHIQCMEWFLQKICRGKKCLNEVVETENMVLTRYRVSWG